MGNGNDSLWLMRLRNGRKMRLLSRCMRVEVVEWRMLEVRSRQVRLSLKFRLTKLGFRSHSGRAGRADLTAYAHSPIIVHEII
jgi:hypothetical protein